MLMFLKEADEKEFKKKYTATWDDKRCKYYHLSYYKNVDIEDSTWDKIQKVSINDYLNNEILGYFYARVNRFCNYIENLGIIRFTDEKHEIFTKDFIQFTTDLFKIYNFNKIVFSVVEGNTIKKMYDKLIKKYNGSYVGCFKKDVKLIDGKLYNQHYYEIFKKDFIKNLKRK